MWPPTAPLCLPIFLRPRTRCPGTEPSLKVPVCWLCWVGSRLAKTDTPSFCSERGQIAGHSEQASSLKPADLPFSQELLGIASEQETRSESGPVCVRLVRKTLQGQPPGRTRGLSARQAGRVPAGRGSLCCPRLRARIRREWGARGRRSKFTRRVGSWRGRGH